jgi:hypothetical protein
MRRDLRPQLWTIVCCTAALVAMIAADCLRVVGLQGLRVSVFCLAGSAILGMMLILEPIVDKRWRIKPARQTTQTLRKDSGRGDRHDGGGLGH